MKSSRSTLVIGSGMPRSPFCPVSDCHELAWVCGPWYLLGRPTCARTRFRDSRKPDHEAGCVLALSIWPMKGMPFRLSALFVSSIDRSSMKANLGLTRH